MQTHVQVDIVEYVPDWGVIIPVLLAVVGLVALVILAFTLRKRQ